MFWEAIFFYGIAATAVVSALLMVLVKNPVVSAAYLVVTFFSIAACFVMLEAQLLAVLQLIVYAGAIMVLFLFVIMLLNLNRTAFTSYKLFFTKLFSLLLLAVILWVAAGGLGGLATGGEGEEGRAPARVPAEYYAFGSSAGGGRRVVGGAGRRAGRVRRGGHPRGCRQSTTPSAPRPCAGKRRRQPRGREKKRATLRSSPRSSSPYTSTRSK